MLEGCGVALMPGVHSQVLGLRLCKVNSQELWTYTLFLKVVSKTTTITTTNQRHQPIPLCNRDGHVFSWDMAVLSGFSPFLGHFSRSSRSSGVERQWVAQFIGLCRHRHCSLMVASETTTTTLRSQFWLKSSITRSFRRFGCCRCEPLCSRHTILPRLCASVLSADPECLIWKSAVSHCCRSRQR